MGEREGSAHPSRWLSRHFGDLFDHLGYSSVNVLRRICYVKPATSPRDRAAYSNIGFFLAGELAERDVSEALLALARLLCSGLWPRPANSST